MNNTPGFYGKLPELGDFVNRRVPNEFIEPWDEWLQRSIATSREQLGEAWLDSYLTSPIWCFALSPGLCGESAWVGLLMPSVDRVGRYFPLTLACKLPDGANPVEAATAGSGWFAEGSDILLSALQDDSFEMETFDGRIAALGSLDSVLSQHLNKTDVGFGTAWQLAMNANDIVQPLASLSAQLLKQRLGGFSLWWGGGSASSSPSMLVCAELPLASDYTAMLNGDWSSGSWEQWAINDQEALSLGFE